MAFKGHRGEFLKGYDRYAKNVTLTYLKSGLYRTAAGGVASILTFLILFYWVCVNVFYAIYNHGSYIESS